MRISVVIADDHAVVREGLRRVLEHGENVNVIGEAVDGQSALELCRKLRPDVALVDIRMPGMNGIELTKALMSEPENITKVVIVTTLEDDDSVYGALEAGATGFLLKRSGPALLYEAIRAAVQGDSLLSPEVTVKLIRRLTSTPKLSASHTALTSRETEIAAQVAEGKTNAEIGSTLFISAGTVKTHLATIQRKINVSNRVGVAMWTVRNGLVVNDAK